MSRMQTDEMRTKNIGWHGTCDLRLINRSLSYGLVDSFTIHQGRCSAPFKLMRGSNNIDGRYEIPILHTAGGLVGGDQLTVKIIGEPGTSALLTTVAAQKVYGSIGRSTFYPKAEQLPEEVFDLSNWCTSDSHAKLFAAIALSIRKEPNIIYKEIKKK